MIFQTKKKDKGIVTLGALGICMMLTLTSCNSVKSSESNRISSENSKDNDEVIINFAVLGKANYITNTVKEFNETDNGYHIELIDYYNDSDSSNM